MDNTMLLLIAGLMLVLLADSLSGDWEMPRWRWLLERLPVRGRKHRD